VERENLLGEENQKNEEEDEEDEEDEEESSLLEAFEEEESDSFSLTQTEQGVNPFVKMKLNLPANAVSFRSNSEKAKVLELNTYGFYDISGKMCFNVKHDSNPEKDSHHFLYDYAVGMGWTLTPKSLYEVKKADYRGDGYSNYGYSITSCNPFFSGTQPANSTESDFRQKYKKEIESIEKWSFFKSKPSSGYSSIFYDKNWNLNFLKDFHLVSHWAYKDSLVVKSHKVQYYSTINTYFEAQNPCKSFNKEKQPLGNQCGDRGSRRGGSGHRPGR